VLLIAGDELLSFPDPALDHPKASEQREPLGVQLGLDEPAYRQRRL
jgi:hypothetical protein